MGDNELVFATLVTSEGECQAAYLLVRSLRQLGGALKNAPFLIFNQNNPNGISRLENLVNVEMLSVTDDNPQAGYFFRAKICAWAMAEELSCQSRTLAWIDPYCLVIREPALLKCGKGIAAALRPVHVRNIGQPINGEIEGFWKGIYAQCKTPIWNDSVVSFVDEKSLLPYFNSHCFSLDPRRKILTRTKKNLEALANNSVFMESFCNDQLHRIFLFQAVLSATITSQVVYQSIRILPADYGYPFHLQDKIKAEKQITKMENMTIMVYEDEQHHKLAFQQLQLNQELQNFKIQI